MSRSRAVSSGTVLGSARRRGAAKKPSIRAATAGPKIACPAATARTALDDLVLPGALEQVAARPGLHGGEDGRVIVVHRQHQHRGLRRRPRGSAGWPRRRRARPSARPSGPRPGAAAGSRRTRLLAVRRLAHDLEVLDRVEQRRRPVRTTGWSSASRIRRVTSPSSRAGTPGGPGSSSRPAREGGTCSGSSHLSLGTADGSIVRHPLEPGGCHEHHTSPRNRPAP